MAKHSERCKQCKENVARLLAKLYGEVRERVSLDLPARLDGYERYPCFKALGRIHKSLQDYREHRVFVRRRHLPPVDYYVPDPGLVVEFDESQHFSGARLVSLRRYPLDLPLGYDRDRWMELCRQLDKHDNDPPWRDEQRAWYDTLRDFSPLVLGHMPTVRLCAGDEQWCALDPEKAAHVEAFYAYFARSWGDGGDHAL